MTAQTVISPDPARNLQYVGVFTTVISVGCALLIGIGVFVDELKNVNLLLLWAIGTAIGGIYAVSFACTWSFTAAKVRYEIDDLNLTAWRGDKVVISVPKIKIRRFEMIGTMDVLHCIIDPAPPPEWPHGGLSYLEGTDERWVALPEIMLWGKDARKGAQDTVCHALGLSIDHPS